MASFVIAISCSGAAGTDTPTARSAFLSPALRSAPVGGAPKRVANAADRARGKCPSALKAVKFYAGRIAYWTGLMGDRKILSLHHGRCPAYLAHVLQRKAYAAHRAYERWLRDEYHWQRWLPRLWYAIGMCETHLDWHFDSGTYVSAFGIIRSAFPGWNGNNTPREQYRVALGIAGRYGLGAWGCYSHGGYRYHM